MFQVCQTETKEKCREEEVEQCQLENEQVSLKFLLYLHSLLQNFLDTVPGVRDCPRGSVRPRYCGELSDFPHTHVHYSTRPGMTTSDVL